jgi:nucleoside-diphosphate-sugar epimerase
VKTILVTGGAGYVGAVLVPKLVKKGYHVKVFDLFLYANETIYPADMRKSGSLELIKGDLRDTELVRKSLKNTDCIIHLAGISNDPSSDLDPELTREVNINAVEKMIDVARELGVSRFINASSSSVYGIKQEPKVTEDLTLEPLTVYSESKVAIEKYLAEKRGKMTAVSIRSATVCGYSPRMRLDLTVNILTQHAVTKNKITVFGGSQKRPNIHIEDISDLYCQLVETPAKLIDGQAYNACGENHTVMQLAELVQKTVAPKAKIETTPTNDLRSYHVTADKIKEKLGYTPKRTIADAVRDVAAAFKDKRIPDDSEERYYNVKTMKKVLAA